MCWPNATVSAGTEVGVFARSATGWCVMAYRNGIGASADMQIPPLRCGMTNVRRERMRTPPLMSRNDKLQTENACRSLRFAAGRQTLEENA